MIQETVQTVAKALQDGQALNYYGLSIAQTHWEEIQAIREQERQRQASMSAWSERWMQGVH